MDSTLDLRMGLLIQHYTIFKLIQLLCLEVLMNSPSYNASRLTAMLIKSCDIPRTGS